MWKDKKSYNLIKDRRIDFINNGVKKKGDCDGMILIKQNGI